MVQRLFFCIAVLLFADCSGMENAECLFPCSKRISEPYGVTTHFAHTTRDFDSEHEQLQMLKDLSIRMVRFDFWVPYGEDMLAHKNIAIISSAEKKVREAGLNTLGILFLGWKNHHAWEKIDLYNEYLDYMMTAYKDKVPYWEVFNEIDMLKKKEARPIKNIAENYMKILPLTYKKIKENNPSAIVTSCSFSNVRTGLLDSLSKMGAYDYFDVLNYHSYVVPEELPSEFEKIRAIMDRYGWNKPVWLTEYGFSTYLDSLDGFNKEDLQKKEMAQAKRLPRAAIISLAYGVDKIFFYNFRARENSFFDKEENFGVIHKDLSKKRAYEALATLIKMLPEGSSRPVLFLERGVYKAKWIRPDERRVTAYWNYNDDGRQMELKLDDEVYNCIGERMRDERIFFLDDCILYSLSTK